MLAVVLLAVPNLSEGRSDAVIERVAVEFKASEQDRLDGLTVDCGPWWFNLRPSNTEPLLRLNLEAMTPELMEKKRDEVLGVIRA